MLIKEKVNLKLYFLGSFINLGLVSLFWTKSWSDFLIYLGILIASIINHYLLAKGISLVLSSSYRTPVKNRGLKAGLYLGGKTVILGGALFLAATYDKEKTLFLVILYIFQLIILGLSIKKAQ